MISTPSVGCFHELNADTPFLDNWHIGLLAAKLEACRRGECRRLIINVPPRSPGRWRPR